LYLAHDEALYASVNRFSVLASIDITEAIINKRVWSVYSGKTGSHWLEFPLNPQTQNTEAKYETVGYFEITS
jgi:hypothetical protein